MVLAYTSRICQSVLSPPLFSRLAHRDFDLATRHCSFHHLHENVCKYQCWCPFRKTSSNLRLLLFLSFPWFQYPARACILWKDSLKDTNHVELDGSLEKICLKRKEVKDKGKKMYWSAISNEKSYYIQNTSFKNTETIPAIVMILICTSAKVNGLTGPFFFIQTIHPWNSQKFYNLWQ